MPCTFCLIHTDQGLNMSSHCTWESRWPASLLRLLVWRTMLALGAVQGNPRPGCGLYLGVRDAHWTSDFQSRCPGAESAGRTWIMYPSISCPPRGGPEGFSDAPGGWQPTSTGISLHFKAGGQEGKWGGLWGNILMRLSGLGLNALRNRHCHHTWELLDIQTLSLAFFPPR